MSFMLHGATQLDIIIDKRTELKKVGLTKTFFLRSSISFSCLSLRTYTCKKFASGGEGPFLFSAPPPKNVSYGPALVTIN